jgi:hypothetical protein
MERDPKYQMSLEQVRDFIRCTRASRYFIENLWINGPGEPTLWKHFNEGVRLLHHSGVIGNINITTNGKSLTRIDAETWKFLNRVQVSIYPDSDYSSFAQNFAQQVHSRSVVIERIKDSFRIFPERRHEDSLPARCDCPGPMIYGDWVYFHCGPAGFGAAQLKEEPFFENDAYGSKLGLGYLEEAQVEKTYGLDQPQRTSRMDLCKYCWANYTISLPWVAHSQIKRARKSPSKELA